MEGDYEPHVNSVACTSVWVGGGEDCYIVRERGKGGYCTYFSRNIFKVDGQGD